MGGQGTLWRRNIADNFNRLSRVHERSTDDRRQTDRRTGDDVYKVRVENACESMCGWLTSVSLVCKGLKLALPLIRRDARPGRPGL